MKLPVRTRNAMLLGNGLIAHVGIVQDYQKKHGKVRQRPYLTYTQLVKQTGERLALVGIGNFLNEIMEAIHASEAPEGMRGLTLFVTNANGDIDYRGDQWFAIKPGNTMQYRKAVLEQDWSDVEFMSSDGGV